MNLLCTKDVVVSERVVYAKGGVYECEKIGDSYEVSSDFGKGVFASDDKTFRSSFSKLKKL